MPTPEISNSASELNLKISKNATFTYRLTWKTKATENSPSVPINNTGYSALMQFRSTPDSAEVLFEASSRNSKIILEGSNGIIKISLSAKDTSDMKFNTCYYDLIVKSPAGVVRRLIKGKVTLEPGISVFNENTV
jgi:tRNA threonylcarbamoyladenosine modification (KEOPS) complex  Pcc1 subunit